MKIAVIGAGWFGCYIGLKLSEKKNHVKIFEKGKDIFLNSSGNNQNRLHLGFHYPRSKQTIDVSKKGFKNFKNEFNFLTKKIKHNIYSIAKKKNSKISFNKYCTILKKSNLKFKKINKKDSVLSLFQNLDGSIMCDEEMILTTKAKNFFNKKLKKKIIFNKEILNIKKKNNKFEIENEQYDVVINCTSFQLNIEKVNKLKYEYCSIFLYKQISKKNHPALTIMDGPFFTLYPWDNKRNFGLYSVKDSRLLTDKNFKKLEKKIRLKIKEKYLSKILKKVEDKFINYYPDFKLHFRFSRFLLSCRSIKDNKSDARVCKVINNNKLISVLPGKIDHIFYAYSKIEKCLKKF